MLMSLKWHLVNKHPPPFEKYVHFKNKNWVHFVTFSTQTMVCIPTILMHLCALFLIIVFVLYDYTNSEHWTLTN